MAKDQKEQADLIGYEALQRQAAYYVTRRALARFAESPGALGDHHFYISFQTQHPGVRLAESLRTRFPFELTIVLQHRYWDLVVEAQHFEVTLTFGGVRERLKVPYSALTRFYDPSVNFVLEFDQIMELAQDSRDHAPLAPETVTGPAAAPGEDAIEDMPAGAKVVSLDAFRRN